MRTARPIDPDGDSLHPEAVNVVTPLYRPDESGLDILHMPRASGFIAPHLHDAWCLVVVERGERLVAWKGGSLALHGGQGALIPARAAHSCESPSEGCGFFALTFSGLELPARAASPCGSAFRLQPGGLVDCLLAALTGGDWPQARGLARRVALEAVAGSMDVSATESATESGTESGTLSGSSGLSRRPVLTPLVARAKGLIDAHDESSRSLDMLARRCGASRSHLSRAFRREVGLSPVDYRALAMLRRARARLAQGVPPREAAQDSGFFDQSHLTRRFKTYMGMTPGLFAQASR